MPYEMHIENKMSLRAKRGNPAYKISSFKEFIKVLDPHVPPSLKLRRTGRFLRILRSLGEVGRLLGKTFFGLLCKFHRASLQYKRA